MIKFTVVIPTYGRDRVLVETLSALLGQEFASREILVLDQSPEHDPETRAQLETWDAKGAIRWIRHQPPGLVGAMNRGLAEAQNGWVLFLDDDILPGEDLLAAYSDVVEACPGLWAFSGQVLQPGQVPVDRGPVRSGPAWLDDLDFPFNSNRSMMIRNVMAGNLLVNKQKVLSIGGYDQAFIPPVSYRFETDLAKRILKAGGEIRFEPRASIHHLAAKRGGTRSLGGHLTSGSPLHGMGDYLFALKHGEGPSKWVYILKRPFREVSTRFHLRHPWWIPVKFVGELRAIRLALRKYGGKGS